MSDKDTRLFPGLSTMTEGPIKKALEQSMCACQDGFVIWEEELARFANQRVERTRDVFSKLQSAKTPVEFASIQTEWAAAASSAYLDEWRALLEICSRTARESLEPFQDLASQSGSGGSAQETERKAPARAAAETKKAA